MTNTAAIQITANGRVYDDETLIGKIRQGGKTFQAIRRNGQSGVDIRKVSQGFRSIDAAAEWIAKGDR